MKKLMLICAPVSSRSGYGDHARDLVLSFLENKDCDIKINDAKEQGEFWQDQNAIHKHMISCLSLSCIDLNRIQRRKFKIIVDAVNGVIPGYIKLSTLKSGYICKISFNALFKTSVVFL